MWSILSIDHILCRCARTAHPRFMFSEGELSHVRGRVVFLGLGLALPLLTRNDRHLNFLTYRLRLRLHCLQFQNLGLFRLKKSQRQRQRLSKAKAKVFHVNFNKKKIQLIFITKVLLLLRVESAAFKYEDSRKLCVCVNRKLSSSVYYL